MKKIALLKTDNPIFTHILTGLERALRENGVITLSTDLAGSTEKTISELKKLRLFAPDYTLFIGLTGIIKAPGMQEDEHFLEKYQLPYIQLYYDFPMDINYLKSFKHTMLCCIFTSDADHIATFTAAGFTRVVALQLAFDRNELHPATQAQPEQDIPVSFIGSLAAETRCAAIFTGLPDPLKQLATQLINRKVHDMSYKIFCPENINPIMQTAHGHETLWYIDSKYTNYLRKRYLFALSQHMEVHVFGNEAWIGTKNINLHPPLNFSERGQVYRRSLINLNFSAAQLNRAANQRVFDCPGMGGLLLSDYREDTAEVFQSAGLSVNLFSSIEQLIQRSLEILQNPKDIVEQNKQLQQLILKQHTWDHRVAKLLGSLNTH